MCILWGLFLLPEENTACAMQQIFSNTHVEAFDLELKKWRVGAEICSFFCDFALQTVTECLGFSTIPGLCPFPVFIFLHAKNLVKLVFGVKFIQHMAEMKPAAAVYSKVYSLPTARSKEQVYLPYLPGVFYL